MKRDIQEIPGHKRTKIRRPQPNGKVEYTHWLYDKEFYKKYKFLSFEDRDKRLKEFTITEDDKRRDRYVRIQSFTMQ